MIYNAKDAYYIADEETITSFCQKLIEIRDAVRHSIIGQFDDYYIHVGRNDSVEDLLTQYERRNDKEIRRNGSGYYDPTAYKAIKHADEEFDRARFQKLLKELRETCDFAGFELEGRVVLKDKRSGKVWR